MPTGPKGQKRPADAIGKAVTVMRIATEEEPEDYGSVPEKNEAAAEMGRKGAAARTANMEDVAMIVEAAAPAPEKRGPYKK